LHPERENPGKRRVANGKIVTNMHNQKKAFCTLIISSISVGKKKMLLRVLQAFLTA
jgi:hypothetical protein